MSKIIGVTVGTPIGVDKLKEKIKPVTSVDGVKADENGDVKVQRTHWKEVERAVTFFSRTDLTSAVYQHSEPIGLQKGEAYEVVVNGNFYDVTPVPYEGVNGDTGLILVKNDGSVRNQYNIGLPFTFVEYDAASAAVKGYYAFVRSDLLDGNGKYYISITGDRITYHKLDKNYLPDDLGGVKTVNGNAPDENGNVQIEVNGGGGVTDYNKLENKPVGETVTHSDTLEWDGNTDGLVSAVGMFFKVSDAVPTKEDCANGMVITFAGETMTAPGEEVQAGFSDDGGFLFEYVNIIPTDNYYFAVAGITFPKAGVYFASMEGMFTSELVIPGYTGFTKTEIKKLDMMYLPEGYPYKETGQVEILPETTVEGGEEVPIMTEIELVEGKTYTVKWNGTEYTCVAQKWETEGATAGVVVGDYGLITTGEPVTGDPFLIADLSAEFSAQVGGVPTMLMCLDGSTSITLSITGEGEVVHKLAGEYLPDGMPYAQPFDDVIMAEWPTNAMTEGDLTYFADPVGKVVEGNWYKVTLGGTVYETVARRNSDNTGFVLGVGSGDNYTLLYGEYPFTIGIFDVPVDLGDGFFVTGVVQLENEVSTDDFSIRGSLKVQEIHERCLPKTATPLIVRCDYDGVADVPYSIVDANALAGRAVYLYRFISPTECNIYSLASVGTNGGYLRFASIANTDVGWLAVMWAKWKYNSNITFGEHRISTTTT